MKRLGMLIAMALLACGRGDGPRQDWLNAGRLDRQRWGQELCGPAAASTLLRPGQAGVSILRWTNFNQIDAAPVVSCDLSYHNETARIWKLDVRAFGRIDRPTADKLIGDLILPYLPPDVQLVARSAAFDPEGTELPSINRQRKIGEFVVEGGFREGEFFRINVALGKPTPMGP